VGRAFGVLPTDVWASLPIRLIQLYYVDIVREKIEDQIFQMRLQGAEVKDPDWLEEEREKPDFSDIRQAFERDKDRYTSMLHKSGSSGPAGGQPIANISSRQSRLMSGARPRGGIL